MDKIQELENEINLIKERNKKVELNKAWETSLTRRVSIIVITYVIMWFTMSIIWSQKPWIDCIIPTLWFFLWWLSLDFMRKIWETKINK